VLRRVICITSDTPALKGGGTDENLLAYVRGTWLASKRNANKSHRSLVSQLLFSIRPIKLVEKQNADITDRLLVLLFLRGCERV
jgi:hypothetical protein